MRRFPSRHEVILVKKTCSLLALVLLASCSKDVPPPEQPAAKPPEPVKAPPKPVPAAKPKAPPLTDAQNAGIKAAFDASRALVKQADALKSKGDMIVKSQGPAAANDTYVQAKDLYHKAVEGVSEWCDGDLGGKVTDAQLKDYLGDYVNELSRWQKSMSELGKIHKDN
jgi:hypothetical protein